MTGVAAAVLALGMVGCSNDAEPVDQPTAGEEATGGDQGPASSDGGGTATDSDEATDDQSEVGASDGGGADAPEARGSAGRPPAVLYIVDGVEEAVDTSQTPWTLTGDGLAGVLAGHEVISDRTAPSCDGELAYTDRSSVNCTASFDMEGLDGEQELTLMAVRAPVGFDPAGSPALLVSIGAPPSAQALETFTDQDNHLVGVGQGSMFGTDELSAAELGEAVQATANSDAGYAPLDSPIAVTECEGALPAGSPDPVGCDVVWEHSTDAGFDAEAMAVWFVDSDPGLLVALEIGDQSTEGESG